MAPLVSPDGRSLLFVRENKPGDIDVWSVELGAGGVTAKPTAAPRVVISGERLQRQVDISPDGRFAACGSSEGGTFGVYVTRFPSGEGKWGVSRGFGVWPRWSARGDRLYFADELYRIVELDVDLKTTFTAGALNRIISNGFPWAGFDRALDGQSFIVPRSRESVGTNRQPVARPELVSAGSEVDSSFVAHVAPTFRDVVRSADFQVDVECARGGPEGARPDIPSGPCPL
jgi:hypothetical protein